MLFLCRGSTWEKSGTTALADNATDWQVRSDYIAANRCVYLENVLDEK